MAKITKINHIAIAVKNIDSSLTIWRDLLGLEVDHIELVESQKSQVAFMPVGDSEVELVSPTTDDSGLAKYLGKNGPGMHHLCFEVDDIHAYLEGLKEKGIRLINDEPVQLPGRMMAFIHPKSTDGVLIEVYQLI